MAERALDHPKIGVVWNAVVTDVVGDEKVTALTLRDVETGAIRLFPADALFIAIGHDPNTEIFRGQIDLEAMPATSGSTDGVSTNVRGRLRRRVTFSTSATNRRSPPRARVAKLRSKLRSIWKISRRRSTPRAFLRRRPSAPNAGVTLKRRRRLRVRRRRRSGCGRAVRRQRLTGLTGLSRLTVRGSCCSRIGGATTSDPAWRRPVTTAGWVVLNCTVDPCGSVTLVPRLAPYATTADDTHRAADIGPDVLTDVVAEDLPDHAAGDRAAGGIPRPVVLALRSFDRRPRLPYRRPSPAGRRRA